MAARAADADGAAEQRGEEQQQLDPEEAPQADGQALASVVGGLHRAEPGAGLVDGVAHAVDGALHRLHLALGDPLLLLDDARRAGVRRAGYRGAAGDAQRAAEQVVDPLPDEEEADEADRRPGDHAVQQPVLAPRRARAGGGDVGAEEHAEEQRQHQPRGIADLHLGLRLIRRCRRQ